MAIRQREKGAAGGAESDFEFRPMRMADLEAVLRLERECFVDPWVRASFVAELEDAPRIRWPLVALRERRLVGYVIAWFIEDEAHIANLAVAPAWRRRGLGRALLSRALTEVRHRGVAWIALEVRASNAAAIALYQALGFRPTGVRRGYYTDSREDAILMLRSFVEEERLLDRDAARGAETEE